MDKQLVSVTSLADIAAIADQVAGSHALADYQARKSEETKRRQRFDLEVFTRFLTSAGYAPGNLYSDLAAWSGISAGLVKMFVKWLEQEGYAIGSINVRLSTVRAYCELASSAGHIGGDELARIKAVKGYRHGEARNINEQRERSRVGTKKAASIFISPVHAALLKREAATSAGNNAARDTLLICLLLDHGLRCEEVANLNRDAINLEAAKLSFYQHKTNKVMVHDLTPDSFQAARRYLATLPASNMSEDQAAPLFAGIEHSREVKEAKSRRRARDQRIAERTIAHLVKRLGAAIGLEKLSPHDCRHYYATDAIRNGTDVKSLQDALGHSSPAMSLRYAESAKVANEKVKLSASNSLANI